MSDVQNADANHATGRGRLGYAAHAHGARGDGYSSHGSSSDDEDRLLFGGDDDDDGYSSDGAAHDGAAAAVAAAHRHDVAAKAAAPAPGRSRSRSRERLRRFGASVRRRLSRSRSRSRERLRRLGGAIRRRFSRSRSSSRSRSRTPPPIVTGGAVVAGGGAGVVLPPRRRRRNYLSPGGRRYYADGRPIIVGGARPPVIYDRGPQVIYDATPPPVVVGGGGGAVVVGGGSDSVAINTPGGAAVPGVTPGFYVKAAAKKDRGDGGEVAKAAAAGAAAAVAAVTGGHPGCGVDKGVAYGAHNVYTTHITLEFSGTPEQMAKGTGKTRAGVSKTDVRSVFAVRLNNPDVVLLDPATLANNADVAHLCLSHAEVVYVHSSMQAHVNVRAAAPLSDLNVVHVDGSGANTVMVSVPPNASLDFSRGTMVLVDRSAQLKSGVFRKFGHVSVARLAGDVTHAAENDADQRPRLDQRSVLADLIAQNRPKLQEMSADKKTGAATWDGSLAADDHGHIRLPMRVLTLAMALYNEQIKPLTQGVVDASDGLYFDCEVAADGDPTAREMANAYGRVDVMLRLHYVYPQSELNKYMEAKRKQVSAKEEFHKDLEHAMRQVSLGAT